MWKVKVLIFVSLVYFGHSLKCYDCDPSSPGQCLNPIQNNDKITECDQSIKTTTCFSIKLDSEINESGIYRGCITTPPEEGPCDYLRSIYEKDLKRCEFCVTDYCNQLP